MPEGFRIATAFVQVKPDMEGFKEELQAKLDEATAGVEGKVRISADTSELDAKVDEARGKIDELSSRRAEPSVRLDDADLSARADEARAQLDELDARSARPDVDLSAGDLDARIDEARAKLDELDARHADPRLNLDDAEFNAKMDRAEARLDALNAKSASPRLGSSGGSAGGGGEGGAGGLLGAITGGIGALMPGIGGAATGLGLLGAVGAMALGPVAKALSEAHQASLNVGLTPQQLASTEFSNSVAIQQAQQNVALAHEQAAQDAVTAARSIESAQMNLASVERSTAESQIQALHSVTQAQQGLEGANYGLSEAQYNLNQAWVQAREDIVRLNDQLADSKLNVQSAQLAIQQALYQQRLTDQNAYSTQIDREQAALAVTRAQQQLKDASDQETAAQYAANLANKQGVEHSQTVIQAKQAVVQATFGVQSAQFQAADAQRQLTLTELNNASQVKQAQMQLAAASEQAAYQRMRDAQQVAFAERNVSNTLREQQLQWAAMMSTENQAANQFAKDMSRLSPAGRDFVNQVLAMSGAFRELEFAAQDAVLPGFTAFLQGVQVLMPIVESGIVQMGHAISNAFIDFGQLMSTPEFATALQGLITNGVEFANVVLPAFAQFVQELGWIGGQQGAVSGLADLLAGIAHGLTGMAASLGDYMPQINEFLSAAGVVIAQIGPPLGQIIGLVAQALEPLTSYLNAHPNGTLAAVLGQIVAAMILFKPLVSVVGAPFRALSSAVSSISGLPAKLKDIVERIVASWGRLIAFLNGTSVAGGAAGAAGRVGAGAAAGTSGLTLLGPGAAPIANRGALGPTSPVPAAAAVTGGWGAALAEALGPLGVAGAAAALVIGIGYLADGAKKAADRAKGVMETSGGELQAASTVGTQHVSDSFRGLADGVATHTQSTANVVAQSSAAVSGRFGLYRDDWSKHNDALVNVMQLGKDQMGQAFGQFASGMGINVEQVGQSLRQQGKTMNQAYTDTMTEVFANLAGKTRESWAQAEQVMTTNLDKYYTTMRQTTTNDYGAMQQAVTQLTTDGYHHRTDLETQDILKLGQVVTQYETDKNNHLIDTSKSNIAQLSTDVATYMADMAKGNSTAAQADLEQLKKDLVGKFDDVASSVDKATSHTLDQEIASAQSDISRVQSSIPLPFAHADGGYIAGPGGPRDDRIPSLLSNGEFVINAKSTSVFRPLLEAINSRRFADGGFVDVTAPRMVNDQRGIVEQLMLSAAEQVQKSAGANNSGGFSGTAVGAIQQYAQSQLARFGWGSNQMGPLINLWNQESSWNPYAVNPSSGAYGIPQSLGHGHPYDLGDYKAQIDWGLNYIASSYGSPAAAWSHEMAYNWYDSGGWLMPNAMPVNGLRKPEAVLTPQESEAFVQIVRQLTAQQGSTQALGARHASINFYGTQYPNVEQMAAIKREMAMALGGVS